MGAQQLLQLEGHHLYRGLGDRLEVSRRQYLKAVGRVALEVIVTLGPAAIVATAEE